MEAKETAVEKMRIVWLVLGALIIALAIGAVLVYARCRRDIRAAQRRVESLGARVVETACGPIEYATLGEGYPVLVIHGIFGGFDQGLVTARKTLGPGFRAIVPSRFGCLGTPLPANASPATQADAYAYLLDALEIERAAVVATSAGGTSAIQFALRHPDRCSGLVLVSSNAPGETEAGLPPRWLVKIIPDVASARWSAS